MAKELLNVVGTLVRSDGQKIEQKTFHLFFKCPEILRHFLYDD